MNDQNFLSTKFLLTVMAVIMCFTLVMVGKMNANEFVTTILGSLGIFVTGNVAQKFSPKLQ